MFCWLLVCRLRLFESWELDHYLSLGARSSVGLWILRGRYTLQGWLLQTSHMVKCIDVAALATYGMDLKLSAVL